MLSRLMRIVALVSCMACTAVPAWGSTQAGQAVDQRALSEGRAGSERVQGDPRRRVYTVRHEQQLSVDGHLDEAAWRDAPVIDDFRQLQPSEGAPATEQTDVRLLFDDDALYVGARLFDSAPDSIIARLGRRDAELDADRFALFIDPFYDHRTGYYFGVNAAGTLYDGVLMNDAWDDETWDGVWEGKAHRDAQGWTVEMRIPYSQLRFYQKDEYVWGVNFRRDIARKGEQAFLAYVPRGESGFVSHFVDLVGIDAIRPRRQAEVVPYTTMRAEYTDHAAADPFNDGSRYTPDAGADFKLGVTSNLTLNATVNPDFGQVEVDPAVVNLSDIETFFPEKRPFFVEGASVFNGFGRGGADDNWGFNWGDPSFFYSRRVGRAPQGSLPEADYARAGDGTPILGAAKLTGRVGDGWNVGTIQALTGRATADLQRDGERFSAETEPLAYYGLFRGQKEFNAGRRALGFLATATLRDFRGGRLRSEINDQAFSGGLDGWTFLDKDRTWVAAGWLGLSHVHGTTEGILALQQGPLHYFQRPGLGAVHVDSSATALTGMAGRFMVNKQRGRVMFNAAAGFISPSFDVNDAGFMWQTNVINSHVMVGYWWNTPTRFYRRMRQNAAVFRSLDFDGHTIWTGAWASNWIQFPDFSTLWVNFAYNPETVNNRRTRGGPLTLNTPGWEVGGFYNSDSRKAWGVGVNGSSYQQRDQGNVNLGVEIGWKPAANIALEVSPGVDWNRDFAQWVGAFDDPLATATFGRRYVFAELDQITLSSSIRLNWTFTPGLSLQLYAQPLVSSGEFSTYKELARSKSYAFLNYGEGGSTFDAATLTADPDGAGPAPAIQLPEQDFNFKSLRGTAVLRWEYRPGSTLFLVWTQRRQDAEDVGQFNFRHSLGRLFDARPDNIFMIKLTYWLSR